MPHRKSVAITLFVIFSCSILFGAAEVVAQGPGKGKLQLSQSAFSTTYYRDDMRIQRDEFEQMLSAVPEAKSQYDSGKSMKVGGSILASIGGFCVGWPIGQKLGGEESPNWTLAAIGGAALVPAIILSVRGDNKIKGSINVYNDSIEAKQSSISNPLKIVLCNKGLLLTYSF